MDYLSYDISTKQTFNNSVYQPDNSLISQDKLMGDLPSDIDIYAIKTDYTLPLRKGSTFEVGYKISYSKTDNIADYRDIIEGEEIPNYDSSNHFKYDEVINASYINFNTKYRRFNFQTGLRFENTNSKGNQLGNAEQPSSKFQRNYSNWFPTVFIQYKLDSIGDNSLVFNYSKRINRPNFQYLNPFVRPLDKFTFYLGNPFLNPSFINNFEISYRHKSIFASTLSYSRFTDDINETIQINDGIYYSQPGNIGTSEFYTFNINAQFNIAKWWSTNAYSDITHAKFDSQLYTEKLVSSGTFWQFTINNSFKWQKGWSAEVSGSYQTDIVNAQFILLSRSNINVGVQKKILKEKATVKLIANDIFYTNQNNGIIKNLRNTDANWKNKLDTRFFAVTFTYSFGKSFSTKNTYNSNGTESERNRV